MAADVVPQMNLFGEPWINSKAGIRRVDDATIEQFQRSCDLLVKELIRASR